MENYLLFTIKSNPKERQSIIESYLSKRVSIGLINLRVYKLVIETIIFWYYFKKLFGICIAWIPQERGTLALLCKNDYQIL